MWLSLCAAFSLHPCGVHQPGGAASVDDIETGAADERFEPNKIRSRRSIGPRSTSQAVKAFVPEDIGNQPPEEGLLEMQQGDRR
jgi:hypothetical protein